MKIEKELGFGFFVAVVFIALAFGLGLWAGSSIDNSHAERECNTRIADAVYDAMADVAPPLSCKENELIEAIKNFSLNGVHLKTYHLSINFDYEDNAPAIVNAVEGE
jgi:hypothetical protein